MFHQSLLKSNTHTHYFHHGHKIKELFSFSGLNIFILGAWCVKRKWFVRDRNVLNSMPNPVHFKYITLLFIRRKYDKFYRERASVRLIPSKIQDEMKHGII